MTGSWNVLQEFTLNPRLKMWLLLSNRSRTFDWIEKISTRNQIKWMCLSQDRYVNPVTDLTPSTLKRSRSTNSTHYKSRRCDYATIISVTRIENTRKSRTAGRLKRRDLNNNRKVLQLVGDSQNVETWKSDGPSVDLNTVKLRDCGWVLAASCLQGIESTDQPKYIIIGLFAQQHENQL